MTSPRGLATGGGFQDVLRARSFRLGGADGRMTRLGELGGQALGVEGSLVGDVNPKQQKDLRRSTERQSKRHRKTTGSVRKDWS